MVVAWQSKKFSTSSFFLISRTGFVPSCKDKNNCYDWQSVVFSSSRDQETYFKATLFRGRRYEKKPPTPCEIRNPRLHGHRANARPLCCRCCCLILTCAQLAEVRVWNLELNEAAIWLWAKARKKTLTGFIWARIRHITYSVLEGNICLALPALPCFPDPEALCQFNPVKLDELIELEELNSCSLLWNDFTKSYLQEG